MWPFTGSSHKEKSGKSEPSLIFFTNTLSGKRELFNSLKPGIATMYSCGPTVYSRAHIGNMRAYVFADTIARILRANGYHLRQVINITDVGHLTGDSDTGNDKMEESAKAEGLRAEDIAARYTALFMQDIALLNIETKDVIFPHATEYIKEQIKMVQELESRGFTYRTSDGIYFDTSKFEGYGKLGGLSDAELKTTNAAELADHVSMAAGRRIAENKEKRNPADFALWKFSPLGATRQQEWPSPWGLGFPGWHIECSAMIRALLGDVIDIHTGGMDHIPIHHNNEIAQSESVLGKPFVRYWLHGGFLTISGEKISKSLKNDIFVTDIADRGYSALALRYFFMQAYYRSPISFTWETLAASNEALMRLWRLSATVEHESKGVSAPSDYQKRFAALVADDLGTPQALAYLWECLRDEDISPKEKRGLIHTADQFLGLSLTDVPEFARSRSVEEVPPDIQALVKDREKARAAHDFEKADQIREKLQNRGYAVENGPNGAIKIFLTNSKK